MKGSSKRKRENIPKHKLTSISKPFLAYLPHEIIQDILCLLPVKTLIVFKCVCKSWFYLISNPQFIKTHLQKSNNYNRQRLVLNQYDTTIHHQKLLSIDIVDNSDAAVIDFPIDLHYPTLIVGSCNGLVCLAFDKIGVFICNPSTKISKKVPLPSRIDFRLVNSAAFGFGYDPLNDDYKVVFILSRARSRKVTKVYSLKANLWRNIGCFPHHCRVLNRQAIYVNGILHWKVIIVDAIKETSVIVSFDLGNESYGEIIIPCFCDECHVFFSTRACLGVLDGCISIYYRSKITDIKEIWVMKEYGNIDTWIKLYTISNSVNYRYSPLCITMTGEILLKGFRNLVLYNPTNGVSRDPNIGKMSNNFIAYMALTYVESLVSPNIDDEVPSPKSLLRGYEGDVVYLKIGPVGEAQPNNSDTKMGHPTQISTLNN